MIEVVTYPADLATWDLKKDPFYLELFGETRPLVDMSYAELLPGDPSDPSAKVAPSAPVYQYWWTIGHDGNPDALEQIWHRLREDAAHVYMFFPLKYGWRIKELMATVQYLQPFHEHVSMAARTLDTLTHVALPLASDAGAVAGAVPALAATAPLLTAVSKLQFNAVPQKVGLDWSVKKVTAPVEGHGVAQGVMWHLPRSMFTDLGGRITGCLALTFIPSGVQRNGEPVDGEPVFMRGPILAHAAVFGPFDAPDFTSRDGPGDPLSRPDPARSRDTDKGLWEPARPRFLELWIEPRVAPTSATRAAGPKGAGGSAGRGGPTPSR